VGDGQASGRRLQGGQSAASQVKHRHSITSSCRLRPHKSGDGVAR
jgi:hypothetical protein